MIDVILATEAIAQIGQELDVVRVKNLAGIFISDPYYISTKEELIVLGHLYGGISLGELAKYLGKPRSQANRIFKACNNTLEFLAIPKLDIEDDLILMNFFEQLEQFKKIGL